MPIYRLNYIDSVGNRVSNIVGREFDDLAAARREALAIVLDFIGDGNGSANQSIFGIIEICSEDGLCLSEIHFPENR